MKRLLVSITWVINSGLLDALHLDFVRSARKARKTAFSL